MPALKVGLPVRRNIPAQRNHAVACECIGYVCDDFIGESIVLVCRLMHEVKGKMLKSEISYWLSVLTASMRS